MGHTRKLSKSSRSKLGTPRVGHNVWKVKLIASDVKFYHLLGGLYKGRPILGGGGGLGLWIKTDKGG